MEFDSGVAPTIQSYYSTISPTILLSVQLSYYQSYYPTISPTILLSVLLYYYQHYYPTISPTILLSVPLLPSHCRQVNSIYLTRAGPATSQYYAGESIDKNHHKEGMDQMDQGPEIYFYTIPE